MIYEQFPALFSVVSLQSVLLLTAVSVLLSFLLGCYRVRRDRESGRLFLNYSFRRHGMAAHRLLAIYLVMLLPFLMYYEAIGYLIFVDAMTLWVSYAGFCLLYLRNTKVHSHAARDIYSFSIPPNEKGEESIEKNGAGFFHQLATAAGPGNAHIFLFVGTISALLTHQNELAGASYVPGDFLFEFFNDRSTFHLMCLAILLVPIFIYLSLRSRVRGESASSD